MSPRTEVEIETQNNTSITASALTESWYQIHEGETTSVNVWFEKNENSESSTVGDMGTTFTPGSSGNLEDAYAEWLQVYDHEKYGGNYYQDIGINHTPQFREQLAEDATITSLLVKISPNSDLTDRGIRPIWGLISGMTGNRNTTLSNWILNIEVLVLSVGERYATHKEIQDDLEV